MVFAKNKFWGQLPLLPPLLRRALLPAEPYHWMQKLVKLS